mmetsp:Transcript_143511/g.267469  ORF Transcript_143511/g.267469 Transcript_143511/m.267469 type:complete len:123 (-) Transcript_143511:301-669(-)
MRHNSSSWLGLCSSNSSCRVTPWQLKEERGDNDDNDDDDDDDDDDDEDEDDGDVDEEDKDDNDDDRSEEQFEEATEYNPEGLSSPHDAAPSLALSGRDGCVSSLGTPCGNAVSLDSASLLHK